MMMCNGTPTRNESTGHVIDICSHVYVETSSQQWICKNSSAHPSCLKVTHGVYNMFTRFLDFKWPRKHLNHIFCREFFVKKWPKLEDRSSVANGSLILYFHIFGATEIGQDSTDPHRS